MKNNNGSGFKKFLGIAAIAGAAVFIAGVVTEFKKLKQAEAEAEEPADEEIPAEEVPAEEVPAEDAPAEEVPAEEMAE